MLARHAESLFWMGRYMERAEDTARMLDVTYHGLLESPPDEATRSWLDLLSVLNLDQGFAERHTEVTAAIVSEFLVLDEKNPGAIVSSVGRARENARSVRELISTELWEAVNMFWLELLARNLRVDLEQQPYELYGLVKRRCQTVNGVAAETMPRDDGWRFLMLGWMLERTEMTCRLLNVRYGELAGATDLGGFHVLVGALKSASASEAYRKAYGAAMDPGRVVEFLLLSRTFPRAFCIASARPSAIWEGSLQVSRSRGPSASSVASGPSSSSVTSTSSSATASSRISTVCRRRCVRLPRRSASSTSETCSSTSIRSSSDNGSKGADACDSTSAIARGSSTTPR